MLDILKTQLPSGLAFFHAGAEAWTQRVEYMRTGDTKPVAAAAPVAPAAVVSRKKRASVAPVTAQIVRYIDELYDMYSNSMKADAQRRFVTHLKEFIGKPPGREFVGRKASREIMSWLAVSGSVPPPDSFLKVCSFLLDARINYGDQTYAWCGDETRTIDLVKN